MIHLIPFPGTPLYVEGNLEKLTEKVLKDAEALKKGGAHGCMLQTEDWVYDTNNETDPVRVAMMAVLVNTVRRELGSDFIIGCSLLWNCMTGNLAAAKTGGADIARGFTFVGSTDSPYGTVHGQTLKVAEARKKYNAENIDLLSCVCGLHHQLPYDKEKTLELTLESIRSGADAVEVNNRD